MTALRPGAPPKPTPVPRERKPLRAKPHRIPDSVREAVLDRAGRVCEWCRRPGGKLIVHHKLLRSQGGKDRLEDCAALHPLCHLYVHSNPYEAAERGLIVSMGSNR
jgi:5-methylcytosine-specific restriction endonuclease McrA